MASYCTIRGSKLSYDVRVESLSDAAHRLYMLLFYAPGRSMSGVRQFVLADALARVPAWNMETAEAALGELADAGLVLHDAQARLVFVVNHFEHQPLNGVNQAKGAWSTLEDLPDSYVLAGALEVIISTAEQAITGNVKAQKKEEIQDVINAASTRLESITGDNSEGGSKGVNGYPGQAETQPKGVRRGFEGG